MARIDPASLGAIVELGWRIIDPIRAAWEQRGEPELSFYESGAWGPPGAHDWIKAQHRAWFNSCPIPGREKEP